MTDPNTPAPVAAPDVAGLPKPYTLAECERISAHYAGDQDDDEDEQYGRQFATLAAILRSVAALEALAARVAALEPAAPAAPPVGDRGEPPPGHPYDRSDRDELGRQLYNAAVAAQRAAAESLARERGIDSSPGDTLMLNRYGFLGWRNGVCDLFGTPEEAAPFESLTTAALDVHRDRKYAHHTATQPAVSAEPRRWRQVAERNGHPVWSLHDDDKVDAGPGTVQWWAIHGEQLREGWFAETGSIPAENDLCNSLHVAMADAERMLGVTGAIRPAAAPVAEAGDEEPRRRWRELPEQYSDRLQYTLHDDDAYRGIGVVAYGAKGWWALTGGKGIRYRDDLHAAMADAERLLNVVDAIRPADPSPRVPAAVSPASAVDGERGEPRVEWRVGDTCDVHRAAAQTEARAYMIPGGHEVRSRVHSHGAGWVVEHRPEDSNAPWQEAAVAEDATALRKQHAAESDRVVMHHAARHEEAARQLERAKGDLAIAKRQRDEFAEANETLRGKLQRAEPSAAAAGEASEPYAERKRLVAAARELLDLAAYDHANDPSNEAESIDAIVAALKNERALGHAAGEAYEREAAKAYGDPTPAQAEAEVEGLREAIRLYRLDILERTDERDAARAELSDLRAKWAAIVRENERLAGEAAGLRERERVLIDCAHAALVALERVPSSPRATHREAEAKRSLEPVRLWFYPVAPEQAPRKEGEA